MITDRGHTDRQGDTQTDRGTHIYIWGHTYIQGILIQIWGHTDRQGDTQINRGHTYRQWDTHTDRDTHR
jgi:hypothetical protein